jgi:transcriptional regulator with XRE-family HTH domain
MANLGEIGATIREHRKGRRLTQQQLARAAGVSRALLTDLETGRLSELGVKKLIRILNAVGLDLRVTTLNLKRPTLEDLLAEEEAGKAI